MFEFKEIVTHTNYYLNYIVACLIRALKRSTIYKTTRRKKNKASKNKTFFTAKFQHLILKAPGNNVKLQLDKNLTTQVFLITKQMGFVFNNNR